MCGGYQLFVYLAFWYCFCCHLSVSQEFVKCSADNLLQCPADSVCTKLNDEFKCICEMGFKQNFSWHPSETQSNISSKYCLPTDKTITYVRSPAKTEHLMIAISLVLLMAILATAFLYLIKVLRPIKRTQAAYVRLQRRRNDHRRLREFDEIDLTFRDPSHTDTQ